MVLDAPVPAAPCFARAATAGKMSTKRRSQHPGVLIGTVRWSFCVPNAEIVDAATAGKMSTKRRCRHARQATVRWRSCVPNVWTLTTLPVSPYQKHQAT